MMNDSHITIDRATILRWIEERNGHPATVQGTNNLHIDFPEHGSGETLEHIGWDHFFDQLQAAKLAFRYQDKTDDGSLSYEYEFVSQEMK